MGEVGRLMVLEAMPVQILVAEVVQVVLRRRILQEQEVVVLSSYLY